MGSQDPQPLSLAILCFAFIENQIVMPAFIKMGAPGEIYRYLDDVILAIGVTGEANLQDIATFVKWMGSPEVYPPPLKLNMELFRSY